MVDEEPQPKKIKSKTYAQIEHDKEVTRQVYEDEVAKFIEEQRLAKVTSRVQLESDALLALQYQEEEKARAHEDQIQKIIDSDLVLKENDEKLSANESLPVE